MDKTELKDKYAQPAYTCISISPPTWLKGFAFYLPAIMNCDIGAPFMMTYLDILFIKHELGSEWTEFL